MKTRVLPRRLRKSRIVMSQQAEESLAYIADHLAELAEILDQAVDLLAKRELKS